MKKKLYIQFENNFFDKIINQKRIEMIKLIKKKIKISDLNDLLDIGTTADSTAKSSNIFCKMLDMIPLHKSISNQKITNNRFRMGRRKTQKITKTGPKNVTTGMCPLCKTIGRIFIIGQIAKERGKCPSCNQEFEL